MSELALAVSAEPLQSAASISALVPNPAGWEVHGRLALARHADWIGGGSQRCLVVGCGRLDEREALLSALEMGADRSLGEPALIALAYARWGPGFAAHLLGDFTFALWDEVRAKLLVVRDPCGSVPAYYCEIGRHLLVASDLRVLLRAPALRLQSNTTALVDYIAELPTNEFETAFVGVRRLPPGYCLVWQDGRARVERHYFPREVRSPPRDADQVDGFLEVLRKAVACRVAAGPSGVMLSGGLDSSLIASLVAEVAPSPPVAFSGGFPHGVPWDERAYQEAVVGHLGAEYCRVPMESVRGGLDIDAALALYGQPGPIGGHWMAWPLMAEANRRGINMIFTGIDGDRVVSNGRGRLQELAENREMSKLWREASATDGFRRGTRAALTKLVLSQLPRQVVRAVDRARATREFDLSSAARLLRPDVLRTLDARTRFAKQHERPWTARENHLAGLERGDRAADLEVMAPLESLHGVAARHPFYDRRVIEFCLALPSDQKLRGGNSRAILREAASGLVPDRVRMRTAKAYFDAPFEGWARRSVAKIDEKSLDFRNLEPILDDRMLRGLLDSRPPLLPVDLLWRCVVVSAWLRQYGLSLA